MSFFACFLLPIWHKSTSAASKSLKLYEGIITVFFGSPFNGSRPFEPTEWDLLRRNSFLQNDVAERQSQSFNETGKRQIKQL